MRVKAPDGLKTPMEGKPRKYITDAAAGVEITLTPYYRRLLQDGSLVEVSEAVDQSDQSDSTAARSRTRSPKPGAADPAEAVTDQATAAAEGGNNA